MITPAQQLVGDEETLARYVLTGSWLYKGGPMVGQTRPNAWIPLPHVELSVFRIDGWSVDQISAKGEDIAAEREARHRVKMLEQGTPYPEGKTSFRYLGYGSVTAKKVRSTGLEVVPKEPPPCHADIINWPPLAHQRKQDEAAQLVFAMRLASLAAYVPPA